MQRMVPIESSILDELVALSHSLGEEARDYVIVGEGNTRARVDENTFFVKASGANLRTIQSDEFVRMDLPTVLTLLDGMPSDEDVKRILLQARRGPDEAPRPSVETVLHAVLYQLTGARFIGHTHPVAVNIVLCSTIAETITRHLMPDEIVVCGRTSLFVPYLDPGVRLARETYARVREFIRQQAESLRVIYLENHGLFALGESPRQVENITAMAVKHARVLAGTYPDKGPRWLDEDAVSRIHTRPDEEVRRARFR